VGFLKPFNLLYLLSVGALVLIYLRARSRPTVDVSSLMLFEERAAPVAKSRVLRVDLPFWLEMLALSALSLTLAGLYLKTMVPAVHHRLHALIFDLGAGMGARDGWGTRLDRARSEALRIIDRGAGDEFTVISYALDAHVRQAQSARLQAVRDSIGKLRARAVAARPAALRAALMNVRAAAEVDLFTDHTPAPGLVDGVGLAGRIVVHMVGAPADNLAIVSLEPGILRSGKGHCVLRNFSPNSKRCDLEIDVGTRPVFRSAVVLDPNGEAVVPFGPLLEGGVVHARIVTPDALSADNDRYAYEPPGTPAQVLVMSPDAQARDDLARVLLAINENFIVTATDPAGLRSSGKLAEQMARPFKLAVMHDSYDGAVKADARLVIFPEPWLKSPGPSPGLAVVGSVALSEMQDSVGLGTLKEPLLLGPARVLELPGWMEALAHGTSAGGHEPFPIAAAGYSGQGRLAVIAFDIRDHLLLNPDKLDALLLTIDTVKRLIAPHGLRIVSTGNSVAVPASGPVRVVAPSGSADTVTPDRWGVVRFRPLDAGRYRIERPGGHAVEVLANYYDAGESDLAAKPPPVRVRDGGGAVAARVPIRPAVHPLGFLLITLALVFVIGESAVLARRAMRWGRHHV
jgi:Aerotolerance regulator N-terminal